ncbi:MAG: porin [Chromatocurvus sp.]
MRKPSTVTRTFFLALPLAWSTFSAALADTEQEQKQDIPALLARIDALETRLREVEARLPASERAPLVVLPPETTTAPDRIVEENLDGAVSGSERVAAVAPQAEPARIDIGGALRYNLVHRDFVDASDGKRGESGFDLFRVNVDGELNNVIISAEYRHYSFMQTIRYGWLGYQFADDSQVQVGINQVPFGLLPYASHNAWFGVPYYAGLADDYDMGVKYTREDGPWSAQLAFYKNEELNDATDAGRYSIDLLRSDEQQNEEVNQFNARLAYTLGAGSRCETEVGGSVKLSELYNSTTDRRGDQWAGSLHVDSRCGRWNLQLQGVRYEYSPANPPGVSNNAVRVGAFAGTYDIASKADILVANVAYNFEPPASFIDQLTCYNDYSRLFKDIDGSVDSQINTLGCAIGSGPLFTYVDYIFAKNMAFFGGGSMAASGEDKWRGRFNVNIGYYW